MNINGDRKIVINEDGKKLKMAFDWKLKGVNNDDIMIWLKDLGLSIPRNTMSRIFKNPFYCGLIAHGMLDGKIIEGIHPAIISKVDFLRINSIMQKRGQLGVPHTKENLNLPLKAILKCDCCQKPLTGYLVKKKNLYYYKCPTKGCKSNHRNIHMHSLFESLLQNYSIRPELVKPLQYELENTFIELNKEKHEREKNLRIRLT